MAKSRRERCPYCGFLDVIKWGKQCDHQRYKCKNCGSLFTFRRKDVSKANRFVWFEWWILRKQTVPQIAELSGCSEGSYIVGLTSILKTIPHGTFRDEKKSIF